MTATITPDEAIDSQTTDKAQTKTETVTQIDLDPASITKELTRRFVATLCNELDELAKAETTGEGKNGQAGLKKPEWAIRLKVAELKLAFLTERSLAAAPASPALSFEDLRSELHRSPAFLQTFTRFMEAGGE